MSKMSKPKAPSLMKMLEEKIAEYESFRGEVEPMLIENVADDLNELVVDYRQDVVESRRSRLIGLVVSNNPDTYVKIISDIWNIKLSIAKGSDIKIHYTDGGKLDYIDVDKIYNERSDYYRLIPTEGHEKIYGETAKVSKLAKKAYEERDMHNKEKSKEL